MARIAIVKLFTGLNLAPAQLSAELKRAGHATRVIYFKDYESRDITEIDDYKITDHPGIMILINKKGQSKKVWNCYREFTETEYQLLINELREFGAEAIAFCVHSGIIDETAQVSRRLKQELGLPVLWGGAGPTLQPERCIAHTDLLCIGEGEEVIVEAANKIDQQQNLDGIEGTWFKTDNGEINKYGKRALGSLDDIAIPNWVTEDYVHINDDQITHNIYPPNLGTEYSIMTQRGCPFSCSFCIESKYQEMFGKKNSLRRRDPQLVIDELKWAKENLGIKTVWFWDDVFTVHPRWLDEFLPLYKQEINLPFWCYTYPTTHNPELLRKLRLAGCSSLTMGVQSGSQRVLSEHFNRPTKTDRVIEAAEEILEAGIDGNFDLITKNHVETEEDLQETFEFLMRFPQKMKYFGFMEMMSFPTFDYTEEVDSLIASDQKLPNASLSEDDYAYYHKLFHLTRTEMPREQIRAIAEDPKFRKNHDLMNVHLDRGDLLKQIVEWRNLAPLTENAFH